MGKDYKTQFLSDNLDFYQLKDEEWYDFSEGIYYKPFAKFVRQNHFEMPELLYIYKEKKTREYSNNCRLFKNIRSAILKFQNKDCQSQYRVLICWIIILSSVMILCELLCLCLLNGYISFLVATLFLCFLFVPMQMIVKLFSTCHVYRYVLNESMIAVSDISCTKSQWNIVLLKKIEILRNYFNNVYEQITTSQMQSLNDEYYSYLLESDQLLNSDNMVRLSVIGKLDDRYFIIQPIMDGK